MSKQLDRIRKDLDYLIDVWPDLVLMLEPGTRRRWSQRRVDPETAARRAEETRQEFEERRKLPPALRLVGAPPGVHPAPIDVSVLDTLQRVARLADELARDVGEWAAQPMGRTFSAHLDPRPYLLHVRAHLSAAQEWDSRVAPWISDKVRQVVADVASHRGELREGQMLDAICPWCGGRTESAPAGGERTISLRHPSVDDEDDEPLIVCHGLNCTPPVTACSRQVGGQPAWPRREWDWLAAQLRRPEKQTAAVGG